MKSSHLNIINLLVFQTLILFFLMGTFFSKPAFAQLKDKKEEQLTEATTGPKYGKKITVQYQVGAEIKARGGACKQITAMIAVPLECEEQTVKIVNEDFSSHIDRVDYRMLQGGARQMLVKIRHLPKGQEARAVVTFEVTTRVTLLPEDTSQLKIPKRIQKNLLLFIKPSPYIQSKDRAIRKLAKSLVKGWDLEDVNKQSVSVSDEAQDETKKQPTGAPEEPAEKPAAEPTGLTDWEKVETFYDYVIDEITYEEGPDKTAVNTLKDKLADCQGRSALFVALCRTQRIPARLVWVDGHCYPEFYLEHAPKKGHWYPCESAGTRAFGEMPIARVVLQRGDNFRVKERPGERLRYATNYMIATPAQKGAKKPHVKFIQEKLLP